MKHMSCLVGKTNNVASEQVRHKPACTRTETAKLICAFVFAYADCWFSHAAAHIVSRMSSYFPNTWPLSYLNLTKNMKTYIRRQQHKNFLNTKTKQKEPPQKYRLGTISNTRLLAGLNRFYMAITSPSASAVVQNI